MKNILLLVFICISITTIYAQNRDVEKIHISHTYEDLYITYIAPLSCDDSQKHGPIVVKDSIMIAEICALLSSSKQCAKYQIPDVRFKIEIFFKDEIRTLCFGQPKEGMVYSNSIFQYNDTLCSYLIKIIKESGAKHPQKVMPPQ